MRLINFRWGVPCLLGASLLIALYFILKPGIMEDWVLDPLTGLVSIVTVLIACSQVANAAYDRRSNLIWQAVVSTLLLIFIAQFFDVLSGTLGRFAGTDDCDDFLILIMAPLMLAIADRSNPALRRARAAIWAGFAVQVASACIDLSGADVVGSSRAAALWSVATDFTELVSVSFYMAAMYLMIVDTSRAIGVLEPAAKGAPVAIPRGRSIPTHAYPPPFVFGWSLPPSDTAAGRIHRLCNRVLWPAGDLFASARNLWLIVTWPLVAVAQALTEIRKQGGEVALVHGKSPKDQFFEQLGLALRHRIAPRYYYAYELFQSARKKDAAHYLLHQETNEVAFKVLCPVSIDEYEASPLADNVDFAKHCDWHNLRHIPLLAVFDEGACVEGSEELPARSLLIKPISAEGGDRWLYVGDHRYRSDDDIELNAAQLLEYFKMLSHASPLLIQSLQRNHILVSSISASALATIRILTARTESGGFDVTNAVFRMPVSPGSPTDSSKDGEIAASIDVTSGQLGPAADMAGNGVAIWHLDHPIAGGRIEGCHLPMWREAKDLVLRAHRTYDDHAIIGWDVALLPEGPTLVGGTIGPDLDILQQAGRAALGSARLGNLLAFNLERSLRSPAPAERSAQLIKSDE
jgi:hypothetical protein